jgi:hypothetical protein
MKTLRRLTALENDPEDVVGKRLPLLAGLTNGVVEIAINTGFQDEEVVVVV